MLTVQVHEAAAESRQCGHGRGTAIGPGPVAPFSIDVAPHHQPVLFDIHTGSGSETFDEWHATHIECRLHHCPLGARSDQITACSLTHQKGEGIDQHGFARTGLAREDVQPGSQREGHILDYRKVTNTKFVQHLLLFSVVEVAPL